MKQQVFYIHGGSSYREYDDYLYDLTHKELWSKSDEESAKKWPATLRTELGDRYQVFTPSMPNSANSKYEEWAIWFERHFEFLDGDVILVGWSQGGMFLLRYLTENKLPFGVKALFILSAPLDYYVSAESKEDGGYFYADPDKIPLLAERIGQIHILHSKDDFVVPYEHAERLAAALPEATLHTFEDKNHFLVPELPELIDLIKKVS